MSNDERRTLSHQYLIRAPAESVFRAISEPDGLTRWLCDRAELSSKLGGAYALSWENGPTHTGTIVDLVPGRRLALAWSWPGVDLAGTVFSLAVEPVGRETLLTVEHSGFPREEVWTDLYGGAEWGWTYFAMNLKSVLEAGRDLRSPRDG